MYSSIFHFFFFKPSVGVCVCEISQEMVDKNLLSQLFNKRRLHFPTQTCRVKLLNQIKDMMKTIVI